MMYRCPKCNKVGMMWCVDAKILFCTNLACNHVIRIVSLKNEQDFVTILKAIEKEKIILKLSREKERNGMDMFTQEEMMKEAMEAIAQRRPGRNKLVYDKVSHTIIAMPVKQPLVETLSEVSKVLHDTVKYLLLELVQSVDAYIIQVLKETKGEMEPIVNDLDSDVGLESVECADGKVKTIINQLKANVEFAKCLGLGVRKEFSSEKDEKSIRWLEDYIEAIENTGISCECKLILPELRNVRDLLVRAYFQFLDRRELKDQITLIDKDRLAVRQELRDTKVANKELRTQLDLTVEATLKDVIDIEKIKKESLARHKIIQQAGEALGIKYPSENRECIVTRINKLYTELAELKRPMEAVDFNTNGMRAVGMELLKQDELIKQDKLINAKIEKLAIRNEKLEAELTKLRRHPVVPTLLLDGAVGQELLKRDVVISGLDYKVQAHLATIRLLRELLQYEKTTAKRIVALFKTSTSKKFTELKDKLQARATESSMFRDNLAKALGMWVGTKKWWDGNKDKKDGMIMNKIAALRKSGKVRSLETFVTKEKENEQLKEQVKKLTCQLLLIDNYCRINDIHLKQALESKDDIKCNKCGKILPPLPPEVKRCPTGYLCRKCSKFHNPLTKDNKWQNGAYIGEVID